MGVGSKLLALQLNRNHPVFMYSDLPDLLLKQTPDRLQIEHIYAFFR